jgi:hypothetical protein
MTGINQKSPDLKFKYVNGMGDLVAAVLHCKIFGWLTKLITGKDKPCEVCSMRRHALNVLIYLPLWKLFFKTRDDLLENLASEYRSMGYDVAINFQTGKIDIKKETITHLPPMDDLANLNK